MKKKFFLTFVIFCGFLFHAVPAVPAEAEWYISNGAGMLLEKTYKTRALRAKYAVSIQTVRPESAPSELRKYWTPPWKIECRVLYENNERLKTQWVFRDALTSYLVAVISNDGSGFIEWYNDNGFIAEEQRLDADGSGYFISYTYRDIYLLKAEAHTVEPRPDAVKKNDEKKGGKNDEKKNEQKQETSQPATVKEPPVPEEESGIPAANENKVEGGAGEMVNEDKNSPSVLAEGAAESENKAESQTENKAKTPETSADAQNVKPKVITMVRDPPGPLEFPAGFVVVSGKEGAPLWTDIYRYTRTQSLRAIDREYHSPQAAEKLIRRNFPRFAAGSANDKEFVSPAAAVATTFLQDVFLEDTAKITYTTDNKRRIVTELRKNEKDEVIGELTNVWEGDRIVEVNWKAGTEERKAEFSYNASGDRIRERDYRNGVLERMVSINKDTEVEELYLNGQLVLKAVWENGKKISEERIQRRLDSK